MTELTADYWANRWRSGNTPWDMGYASPPLMHYAGQFSPNTRILIPGAGSAYEAVALHERGYNAVYVCDWVSDAFDHLRRAAPNFPEEHLLIADFFELEPSYDLILEQTFFSALPPTRRSAYALKVKELLRPGGRLGGVLFARPFPHEGPPFGLHPENYRALFEHHFRILQLDPSPHSIPPRKDREIFIELETV